MLYQGSFPLIYNSLASDLLHSGNAVDTGHWQALQGVPQTKTIELLHVQIQTLIPERVDEWEGTVIPSQPWAEDQFQERVAGEPLNPGETYKYWPWYKGNVASHQDEEEKFSHTYMERFWPRVAGSKIHGEPHYGNRGIRYRYGDLNDVLNLLAREPYTRQAYLPIFFPEDTGAHHGERIPCTLGYHLMLRGGRLHCFYPIRSCDFLRHFKDDVYMAGRLVQWVLNQLQDDGGWQSVRPGQLTMFASSMHVFDHESDRKALERDHADVS